MIPSQSAITDWPFQETKNLAVITTRRITSTNAPILYVFHDEEGEWQFLDGEENDATSAVVIGLYTLTQIDPSLLCLAELPMEWEAWRETKDATWQ